VKDRFSKLVPVASVIAILLWYPFVSRAQTPSVKGRAPVTWEYKTIYRGRDFSSTVPNPLIPAIQQAASINTAQTAGDWAEWYEDGQELKGSPTMTMKLAQLGAQGWELAAISPRSSMTSTWAAGTTTDETWVFKRLKP